MLKLLGQSVPAIMLCWAEVLLGGLHQLALTDIALAKASPQRIRLTLLKIVALVIRNTRRIRLLMSSVAIATVCSDFELGSKSLFSKKTIHLQLATLFLLASTIQAIDIKK